MKPFKEEHSYLVDENGEVWHLVKAIPITCDVCGYVDKTKLKTAVQLGKDGVYRCHVCRGRIEGNPRKYLRGGV